MPYSDWVSYYSYSSHERVLQPLVEDMVEKEQVVEGISMDKHDLVIFDLHGTLVCAHKKFMLWIKKLTDRYSNELLIFFI